jgi:pimeloyl-ACP methyl ester carboxylesterase
MSHAAPRASRRLAPLGLMAALLLLLLPVGAATASAAGGRAAAAKPTVVLVHGAWADASGWNGVAGRLQARGYDVIAPANPLRGVPTDTAYLKSVLASIKGPIVLVGHSYGGMVITNAATGNPNVKALVYVAAFAPEQGETAGGIEMLNPGSQAAGANLTIRPFDGGKDVYITPADFHQVFCADVPARQSALMAAEQRPLALSTFGDVSGVPAWKTIPSWYMVAQHDHAIPPATERFMAKRMKATTVEEDSSHVAMISHPADVAKLVLRATATVR